MRKHTQQRFLGFTVAELLIAITIIGILVSIVLVVYPGYQLRTRNNERKSDMQQVAAALSAYAIQENNYVSTGSGCGVGGNGNGWLAGIGTVQGALYPKSILTCLQDKDIIEAIDFVDPSGCVWDSGGACGTYASQPVKAYMKATCLKSAKPITYVFAYLESEPPKVAEVDALCDAGSVAGFDTLGQKWGTNYGMNYYLVVK